MKTANEYENIILENNKAQVDNNLKYFKDLGVKNLDEITLKRIDLLFADINILDSKIKKFDKDLILFIIEKDISLLNIFGI